MYLGHVGVQALLPQRILVLQLAEDVVHRSSGCGGDSSIGRAEQAGGGQRARHGGGCSERGRPLQAACH